MCVSTDLLVISQRDAGKRVRRAVTCVIHFRTSRISYKALVRNDKRLSVMTNACQKQQSFVGNDKRLSEMTNNACRKRQSLVGNDKALSENLSLAEKDLRRSISLLYVPCRNKNSKQMLVGLCRFFVVLFFVNGK